MPRRRHAAVAHAFMPATATVIAANTALLVNTPIRLHAAVISLFISTACRHVYTYVIIIIIRHCFLPSHAILSLPSFIPPPSRHYRDTITLISSSLALRRFQYCSRQSRPATYTILLKLVTSLHLHYLFFSPSLEVILLPWPAYMLLRQAFDAIVSRLVRLPSFFGVIFHYHERYYRWLYRCH